MAVYRQKWIGSMKVGDQQENRAWADNDDEPDEGSPEWRNKRAAERLARDEAIVAAGGERFYAVSV